MWCVCVCLCNRSVQQPARATYATETASYKCGMKRNRGYEFGLTKRQCSKLGGGGGGRGGNRIL